MVKVDYDAKQRRLVRQITSFREIGGRNRCSHERHELQLYRASEVAGALRRVGFRVRTLRSFGEYELLPSHIGVVAKKC
jgi:hypothetical protein